MKFSICIFTKRQNLRFTGEGWFDSVCSRMRVCIAGQHDWQVKFLAGQVTILARHSLFIDHYLSPVVMSQNTAATKAWGGENGAFPFWLTPKCATQQEESELEVQGQGFKPLVHVTPLCPNVGQEGLTPWG